MIDTTTRKIILLGIAVRLAILSYGILVDYLVQDYDTCNRRYIPMNDQLHSNSSSRHHGITNNDASALAGFANWDAIYFTRIAQVGDYEYEHFHAFFPFIQFLFVVFLSVCF